MNESSRQRGFTLASFLGRGIYPKITNFATKKITPMDSWAPAAIDFFYWTMLFQSCLSVGTMARRLIIATVGTQTSPFANFFLHFIHTFMYFCFVCPFFFRVVFCFDVLVTFNYYFARLGGAKYCGERVCMSVCLLVCLSARMTQKHTSKLHEIIVIRVIQGRGLVVR